jgi:hypothetical protein
MRRARQANANAAKYHRDKEGINVKKALIEVNNGGNIGLNKGCFNNFTSMNVIRFIDINKMGVQQIKFDLIT